MPLPRLSDARISAARDNPGEIPFDTNLSVTRNTVCPLSVITFLAKIEIRARRVYTPATIVLGPCIHRHGVRQCLGGWCVCIQLHCVYTRASISTLRAGRTRGVLETGAIELPSDVLLSCLFIVYSEIWTSVLAHDRKSSCSSPFKAL